MAFKWVQIYGVCFFHLCMWTHAFKYIQPFVSDVFSYTLVQFKDKPDVYTLGVGTRVQQETLHSNICI